jgi:hypothetical protein
MNNLLGSWDDANAVASSTGRISLGPQVAALQRIRRDMEADPWPACGADFKKTTLRAMDKTINGYLLFMRGSSAFSGSLEMKEADAAWADWSVELSQL